MNTYSAVLELWRGYDLQTESDIDLRLDSFRVLFAYNSGKIENENITYHDTREIFENGRIINYTGDTRAVFEVTNQKLCYEFLKPHIVAKTPITLDFIKEIHEILASGTYDERRFVELGERPGEFKKHDFVTGEDEVGALPEDVEPEMADLLAELEENEGKDALKVATYFHLRFEYIHPFADGNGRVGRTLMNYYLMTHGHPPVIVYEKDKNQYYDALQSYDRQEDLSSMYQFLKAQCCETWKGRLPGGRNNTREKNLTDF